MGPALVAAVILATAAQTLLIYRASARMWQPTYIISQPSLTGGALEQNPNGEQPDRKNNAAARTPEQSGEQKKADNSPDPRENLMKARGEMERVFEAALNALTASQNGAAPDFHPPGDVVEDGPLFIAHVDAPGAEPDSIQISTNGDKLLVSGKTCPPPGGEKDRRSELRRGSFQREFVLPRAVDAEKGSAEYRNGVIIVKVPKSDGENSKKTVKLKVSVEKR